MKQHVLTPALVAATIFTLSLTAAVAATGGKVGDKAPAFSATTLDGKTVALSDYLGKQPLHLIFWATWCPNCLKEIPEINELQEKLGHRLTILAINVGINDTPEAARQYRKKHGMGYPVIFDTDNAITRAYGVVGTPTQILIGTDGIIRYRNPHTPKVSDIEAHWDLLVRGAASH